MRCFRIPKRQSNGTGVESQWWIYRYHVWVSIQKEGKMIFMLGSLNKAWELVQGVDERPRSFEEVCHEWFEVRN